MKPSPSTSTPGKRKRAQVIDLTGSPDTPSKKTPSKRQKATPAESPEKRAKRYRDHAPLSIMTKYERVMTQRMYMMERSGRKDGSLEEEFSVLGSTGNVYTVTVNQIPRYVVFVVFDIVVRVRISSRIKSIVSISSLCLWRSSNCRILCGFKLPSYLLYPFCGAIAYAGTWRDLFKDRGSSACSLRKSYFPL